MIVPDGFGFSPASGDFEIKDNKAYWADGDITDFATQWCFRWMRVADGVHYSEWSDEQRATVKAEWAEKRRADEAMQRRVLVYERKAMPQADGNSFPNTMDAQVWTREWLRTIKEHPGIPTDEGTMLSWFANAIMAGWDEAMRRQERERDAFL